MGKNRDRLSIIAAILEASSEGSSKTHIMYQANLSFSLLEKYLAIACSSGLIEHQSFRYHLTKRGKEFLKTYLQFEDRYIEAQRMLQSLSYEREQLTKSFKASHKSAKKSNAIIESE